MFEACELTKMNVLLSKPVILGELPMEEEDPRPNNRWWDD